METTNQRVRVPQGDWARRIEDAHRRGVPMFRRPDAHLDRDVVPDFQGKLSL